MLFVGILVRNRRYFFNPLGIYSLESADILLTYNLGSEFNIVGLALFHISGLWMVPMRAQ